MVNVTGCRVDDLWLSCKASPSWEYFGIRPNPGKEVLSVNVPQRFLAHLHYYKNVEVYGTIAQKHSFSFNSICIITPN